MGRMGRAGPLTGGNGGAAMKKLPFIPTVVVALAVAAMVGLGIWQLDRKSEKERQIALFEANRTMPAIAYPAMGPVLDSMMFRKSSANCLQLVRWQSSAGRDATGKSGIRYIAECRTAGGEGPGLVLLAGVADRPDLSPKWQGGIVEGTIVTEPDQRNLLQKTFGETRVLRPMLVARDGVAGLRAPAQPSLQDVPNNHLAYAVQWFLFAGAAALIYLLALRRRS